MHSDGIVLPEFHTFDFDPHPIWDTQHHAESQEPFELKSKSGGVTGQREGRFAKYKQLPPDWGHHDKGASRKKKKVA
jgi:hypothetical protein